MRELLKNIKYFQKLNIEEIKDLNLGIEIQDFTEPNLSKVEKDRILNFYKEKLDGFNNTIAVHGPFLDLKPASPDNLIKKVSQDRYIETLEFAKELNAEYVIFHSQINPRINKENLVELINKQTKESFEYILSKSEYDGYIVIENIFEYNPEALLRLVETIDNEKVGINLDIGHTMLTDCRLEVWIEELNNYIKYMHIHSNNRVYDTHSIPTKEEVDNVINLLDKYNLNPKLCLEYDTINLKSEIEKYKRYIK